MSMVEGNWWVSACETEMVKLILTSEQVVLLKHKGTFTKITQRSVQTKDLNSITVPWFINKMLDLIQFNVEHETLHFNICVPV